jgi:gamma-glutamylcyclotransferase (GGCT)/AIG2-like uncharacterized protein YtfP
MAHLFAYGTLMCEDIMQEVSGCRPSPLKATLTGYSRRRVRGEDYPGLLPWEPGRVEGVVYRDLPEPAWRRLDRFEGAMYTRLGVAVELECGGRLAAETYVVHPQWTDRLEEVEWDFADFLRRGKMRFKAGYEGYRHLE